MPAFPEYHEYDGLGLADLVRRRQVKPSELTEEAIGHIENLNPKLNAVIHTMFEQAREMAGGDLPDGPFAGVPFLLKDMMTACAGAPLCNGSRFYLGFVPDHDSEMVKRFKAAGVIIIGKTNAPEYGLVPVTEPELFGPTNNPWDLTRTPGGSSGGSAAAVAACIVPLAHGNDGGGSIRIPGSCCASLASNPPAGAIPLARIWEKPGTGWPVTMSLLVRSATALPCWMPLQDRTWVPPTMPPHRAVPSLARSMQIPADYASPSPHSHYSPPLFIRTASRAWSRRSSYARTWATRLQKRRCRSTAKLLPRPS